MNGTTIDIEDLAAAVVARHGARRLLVGIAGAPGSGKSTLADRLAETINAARPALAAVLPMDGFHYDDSVLTALSLLPRKGAPETFDVAGLGHLLRRLRENSEDRIAVPVFDRAIEIARAGARLISVETGIVIVEGNYLLLNRSPWNTLKDLFDVTVMIDTPPDTLRRRLTARWEGFALSQAEISRKVEQNDMPNGLVVIGESAAADYRLSN